MKCPVCKDIQVDPCTLQCGHTVCQLCLARMWKSQNQFCPLCKDHWQVYPAITIDYRYMANMHCVQCLYTPDLKFNYRDNIEKFYSDKIVQLRNSYTPEDKELIKEFLSTKNSSSPVSDTQEQEIDVQGSVEEEYKQGYALSLSLSSLLSLSHSLALSLSLKLFLTSIYLIFASDVTGNYEELQLTPASEPSEPLLYQSSDDKEDNVERWYSQSVKEESTQEHNIYAAPRHKSVGSKSSIKLSRRSLLSL